MPLDTWIGYGRVAFNSWHLRKRGADLGPHTWISGWIDLKLAGSATFTTGRGMFVPRTIEVRGNDEGRIIIGDEVTIDSGARLSVANKAVMTIGNNAGIGPYNILNAFDDLTIGSDTMFGPFVNINCADHGIELGTPMRLQYGTYGPVVIGRDCWLGAGVVVTKGVTIGDGAVIGAGSVVTCDIPERAVACGTPARVVRQRSESDQGPVCGDECKA